MAFMFVLCSFVFTLLTNARNVYNGATHHIRLVPSPRGYAMTYREIMNAYREERAYARECREIQLAAIIREDYTLADEAAIAAMMHDLAANEILSTKGECLAEWGY